ncbi:site-2 protease family protein [Bacillus horti]|uniref:Membrane-associated protease RseP (Regulator of RpoE activity) n=1 Tax=Caldalkalibacillus horti TaxID=77523 RepID=A0ABT9W3M4_9BACI|nr:site-2 protease family protein [Bacillus horti]MDQ0167832.1 membrane-associated protease RseP (regulator of RpoE activity) [Bacillus horti]
MDYMVIISLFIITLPVASIIHEWGHFIGARLLGVQVERVHIGTGAHFFKWKQGSTEFQYNWNCFLGGYYILDNEESYPRWKRMIIIFAGSTTSLLVYIIAFLVDYFFITVNGTFWGNWFYIFMVVNAYMGVIQLFPFRKDVSLKEAGHPSDGLNLTRLIVNKKGGGNK